MNWKKAMVSILGIILFIGILYYANMDRPKYVTDRNSGIEYETARVLSILADNSQIDETTENIVRGSVHLKLEIMTGRYKGDIVETTNYLSYKYNVIVEEGDKVSIRIDTTGDNQYTVSIYNYARSGIILAMVAVFFLALILTGGKQGAKAVLGLIFTFVCIIFILVPLLLKGFPAIPTTVGIIAITTVVSFLLIGGFESKIIAAFLGSMTGVVCAAVLALLGGYLCQITGFNMDEAESLLYVKFDSLLHVKGLFICGVLIASIGAVMDIAMSISSAVNEVYLANPALNRKQLVRSGMTIGRDAMGTMANTLILAFAGASLNMIILIFSYGVSFTQLMNTDFVAIEVIRGIAGSLGIICTVPASAYLSAFIILKKNKKQ